MATIYRKTDKRTPPDDPAAEFFTRKGTRYVRFTDGRGRRQTYPLSVDGAAMLVERRCWYIDYTGPDGRTLTVKGFTDKAASEAKGRELEKQAERKRAGLHTVDAEKVATGFGDALDLYKADLQRLGRDPMYVYACCKRLGKLSEECAWPTVASIRAESLTKWLSRQTSAAATKNQYIETAQAFCGFLVGQGFLEGNPLAMVVKGDETIKVRRRRALTPEQMGKLLEVAPQYRRSVYLSAMLTGLRKKELRRLTWGNVFLDEENPCIELTAEHTNSKRADVLPINVELLELFRRMKPAHGTLTTRVFKVIPKLATFQRDLEAAKIPYRDEEGRQADFHALRHSFCTMLARQGVPIQTAMRLMRHSDIRLTSAVYTDARLLDLQGAVAGLPTLGAILTAAQAGQVA